MAVLDNDGLQMVGQILIKNIIVVQIKLEGRRPAQLASAPNSGGAAAAAGRASPPVAEAGRV